MIQSNFFIVRHGESENNFLKIDSSKLKNKNQFGLTENGKNEIKEEAKRFNNFDIIFSSPFRRAKETAAIFAKTSQCKIIEDELLKEVHVGDFELCKYEESEAFEKHNNESTPYPNGESLLDAKKRAIKFFEQTRQQHKNQKILIVTHGWIELFLIEHTDKNFNREEYLKKYNLKKRKVTKLSTC